MARRDDSKRDAKVPLKAIDSKIAAVQKAQRAELQLKLFPRGRARR